MVLVLNQDRTFKLVKVVNNNEKTYLGFWENEQYILTLDLSQYEEIENLKLEYNINRNKLIGLNQKRIKFKKTEKN